MQIELRLNDPPAAPQASEHVGAETRTQKCLFAFDLLADVPRMRRGLVPVLRRMQRVALVLHRLLRKRSGARLRHTGSFCRRQSRDVGEGVMEVDVAVGVLRCAERSLAAVGARWRRLRRSLRMRMRA